MKIKKIFFLLCLTSILIILLHINQLLSRANDCAVPCDPVHSDSTNCEPCEPIGCSPYELEICSADNFFNKYKKHNHCLLNNIEITGWIQGGFFANAHGSTIKRSKQPNYNGKKTTKFEETSGNGYYFGNTHSTDFQINQVCIELTKEADGKHGLDWGFSTGIFFGTDAWFTQSFADANFDYGWQNGDYFTSIPTLLFQLAYGDLSVKFGKFETYIGYESLKAPDALFYSHPYSFMFETSTHAGVLAEYTPTEKLQLVLAYTAGADGSLENKYDDHGLLSSVSYQFTDKLNLTYTMMYQRYGGGVYENGNLRDFANSNQFFHTFLASCELSKNLTYVLQWTLGDTKNRLNLSHDRLKGIGNYIKYKIDKFWSIGFRTEWFVTKGIDYSDYTIGLTWKPNETLIIRPEIRYDHVSDKVNKPFNDGKNRDQFSGGITGVVMF
ncbi:MAG: porin [Planctomycetaceae bacterium]|nr:porin [Planctomycetaceae bacterium]